MPRKLIRLDCTAIRATLHALGRDQTWLAERSGESKSLLSKILNTGQPTSPEKAENIALALGTTVDRLRCPAPAIQLGPLPVPLSEHWVERPELRVLDAAWSSAAVHVVSVTAWGGAGKTSLVRRWLAKLASHGYRGAHAVFVWSFDEPQQTVAMFLTAAIHFLGATPRPGHLPRQLLDLLQQRRILLVVDGIDRFQAPTGSLHQGAVLDPELRYLLVHLAADNPARGLCVLTARQPVRDLAEFESAGLTRRITLPPLSPAQGTSLLRALGVTAAPAELNAMVETFDGHCLTLTLLGYCLARCKNGDGSGWRKVRLLDADERMGLHLSRVMNSYLRWVSEDSKQHTEKVLCLFSLLEQPANGDILQAFRSAAIPGLTDFLHPSLLDEDDWQLLLADLRQANLLLSRPGSPPALAVHALVREFFARRLAREQPDAYRAARTWLDRLKLGVA